MTSLNPYPTDDISKHRQLEKRLLEYNFYFDLLDIILAPQALDFVNVTHLL